MCPSADDLICLQSAGISLSNQLVSVVIANREGSSNNIIIDNSMINNTYGVSFFTDLDGKDPGMYPTKDNWVIGNKFRDNRNAISLGGLRGNGATDNLIAENDITGNGNGWWCNNALVGNHVLTSDTKDNNFLEGSKYCSGAQTDANVSFFAEPPPLH